MHNYRANWFLTMESAVASGKTGELARSYATRPEKAKYTG